MFKRKSGRRITPVLMQSLSLKISSYFDAIRESGARAAILPENLSRHSRKLKLSQSASLVFALKPLWPGLLIIQWIETKTLKTP